MKIHITNLYNFKQGDILVERQHQFATAGRALGFLEMGIFSYLVETDTRAELSKRLDGIIAALESEDVVFIQMPTENGFDYEKLLVQKCKAYRNTKIVLILHDMLFFSEDAEKEMQTAYLSLYKLTDALIVPEIRDVEKVSRYGFHNILCLDDNPMLPQISQSVSEGYSSLRKSGFYMKKILMDAIELVFLPQNKLMISTICATKDEVHIGFGLHDETGNYSVWVGTAMQSVIEHTDAPICFHILHDKTLNEQNRNRLIQVATQNKNRICFHALDETLWENSYNQMSFYTIGALFRIALPELLPELSKIIYLDADILVNRDIKELWDIDINSYCLAAVPDADVVSGLVRPTAVKYDGVVAERYFNSGVLYMNLDYIRTKGNMRRSVLDYLNRRQESNLPVQDALNVIYGQETLLLDGAWNCFVQPLQAQGKRMLENKIYHFVGTRCRLYSSAAVDRLLYETTGRTPWKDEECRNQLDKSLKRACDRVDLFKKVIDQISASSKKYIFYGEETFAMRNMYNLVTVREGDYRVLAEIKETNNFLLPCKALEKLSEEREDFIVFVLPEADKGTSINRLEQLGLENEKDFFVIPRLLEPYQGGYA